MRVPMRAHQLIDIFTEEQITDLRPSVNTVHHFPKVRVPESNTPVSSPTARRQQPMLMRRPGERLDRGLMGRAFEDRISGLWGPDE